MSEIDIVYRTHCVRIGGPDAIKCYCIYRRTIPALWIPAWNVETGRPIPRFSYSSDTVARSRRKDGDVCECAIDDHLAAIKAAVERVNGLDE